MHSASHRAVCVLLAGLLAGAHWAVLQGAALAGMAVVYSGKAGLAKGLAETFDGAHPCCMCKAIKKARADESAQQKNPATAAKEPARLLGIAQRPDAQLAPPAPRLRRLSTTRLAPEPRPERPPVPPPR